jgi:hypothetical protein
MLETTEAMLMIEPEPLSSMAGQKRLDHAIVRLDVEIERKVPVLFVAVEHRAVVHEAGAVEQDVNGAGLTHRRGDVVVLEHVEHERVERRPGPRPSGLEGLAIDDRWRTLAPSRAMASAEALPMP